MKKTLFILLTLLAALLVFVSCDESLDADVFNSGSSPVGPVDPKAIPLTLDFTGNGNLKIQKEGYWSSTGITMWYSKDGGATTTALEFSGTTATISVSDGESVSLYGTMGVVAMSKSVSGHLEIKCDGITGFNARGNVMSLVSKDDFANLDSMESTIGFYNLFYNNDFLVSAEDLLLPATTLANSCYSNMFFGCTSLTTAPALPATTLADGCYEYMFYNCESLTTAPALPAETLANGCYMYMFSGCTSLTTAPELPAATLVNDCYYGMFDSCTGLTTAPTLPAMTLAEGCYYLMFSGCTSLTTAPTLPAITLAEECYRDMFSDCTSLTTAPALPAPTLADGCYMYMFAYCTSLTTAPELPAATLVKFCYDNMFRGCSSLNSITCLATDISAYDCTTDWVYGVAATGTFTKAPSMTGWTTGNNGIPSGWTTAPTT